jgi:hypothetical protein
MTTSVTSPPAAIQLQIQTVSPSESSTPETTPKSIINIHPYATKIQAVMRSHLTKIHNKETHNTPAKIRAIALKKLHQNRKNLLALKKRLEALRKPRKWYHFLPSLPDKKTALTHIAIATTVLGALYIKDVMCEETPLFRMMTKWWSNAGNRFYMNEPKSWARARSGLKVGLLKHIAELGLGISLAAITRFAISNPRCAGKILFDTLTPKYFDLKIY